MNEILAFLKLQFSGAVWWHARGRYRDFAEGQDTFSVKTCYIIKRNKEEFIYLQAKTQRSERVEFVGIVLSRLTSSVELQLAKKLLPTREWKVLVMSLPKETNQRLLLLRKAIDQGKIMEILGSAEVIYRKFLTGVKNLVSKLALDL